MASTLDGNESPPYILDPIENGNRESPPQLQEDVVKIVVIGEPRCGKTRFIRQYYNHHSPVEIYSHNGVRVYSCLLQERNLSRRASIFEIPGYSGFIPEQRIPHYEEADIIVFMYAIDDPTSFQMLTEKWLVETIDIIESRALPVVFVGSKKDLRENQKVIERLAMKKKRPVTLKQGGEMLKKVPGKVGLVECSAHDLGMVEKAFNLIFAKVRLTD